MKCNLSQKGMVLEPESLTEIYALEVFLTSNPQIEPLVSYVGKENLPLPLAAVETKEEKVVEVKEEKKVAPKKEKKVAPKEDPVVEAVVANVTQPLVQEVEEDIFGEEVKPAVPEVVKYTLEQVREALKAYAGAHGAEKAKAIIGAYDGCASISKLPEKHYAAVMQAMGAK